MFVAPSKDGANYTPPFQTLLPLEPAAPVLPVVALSGPRIGAPAIAAPNRIDGTDGKDYLVGSQESDQIFGYGSNDFVMAEAGHDWVFGGGGNDVLFGGEGDDTLYGEAGHDSLEGNQGNDWLEGGPGNDILYGGLGINRLIGGTGADTFRIGGLPMDELLNYAGLGKVADGFSWVNDFNPSQGDRLNFRMVARREAFADLANPTDLARYLTFQQVEADTHVLVTTPQGNTTLEAVLLNVDASTITPAMLEFTAPPPMV